MASLQSPVYANSQRSYWLSNVPQDISHNYITTNLLDANFANISSLFANEAIISSAKFSTTSLQNIDVSGAFVSSITGNFARFSTVQWDSDLSGGLGFTLIRSDPSGVLVSGDPIIFSNLVYLYSTINVIQVSTIIDTDIFAQKGYFSTISTGNLSAGQASIQNANISSLTVSSLQAFDISGAEPQEWSLYPTLNSSITFQPGFVLSNVGSNIFFAGQNLLADLSGANLWSIFPAQSTILANNNSITGLSTLFFQDGSQFYSQTGNNLFYNGQPIQYGANSNVSKWANFSAVNNVNMNTSSITNATLLSASNIVLTGSNVTNGNTFTNSLGVGGTSLVSLATIDSGGDVTCRNLTVGDTVTSLADVAIYGNTALPGDNALYVTGGVTFTGNGVPVHGQTFGCGVQVGGFDTIRMDILPAAGIFQTTVLPWAATSAVAASLTAGGALTLAAGSYIEANASDFNLINTTSGNKNTILTVGTIGSPPNIAATSSLTIQNIAGGGIEIQAGGQGSITGFSTIQGFNLSSINLNVSTINGLPIDISGNPFVNINTFSTLFTSSLQVSSIQPVGGFPINILGSLKFETPNAIDNVDVINLNSQQPPQLLINASTIILGGNNILTTSLSTQRHQVANSRIVTLDVITETVSTLNVSTINQIGGTAIKIDGTLQFVTPNSIDRVVNINLDDNMPSLTLNAVDIFLGALSNTYAGSLSTVRNTILEGTISSLTGRNRVALSSSIDFLGTPFTSRLEQSQCGTVSTLCLTSANTSNLVPIITGGLIVGGNTAPGFSGSVLFSTTGSSAFGVTMNQIGGNGAFQGTYLRMEETTQVDLLVDIPCLSTIQGVIGNGPGQSNIPPTINFSTIFRGPILSSQELYVSTINGSVPGGGGAVSNQFSTLGTSSFTFSTATSVGSNTNFNYPIFIDYDQAGNTTTAGVAIAVQGHNLGSGAVVNRLEMGARATGENYIMSVWPGQNLEELFIDATDLTVRDGTFSTIINLDPFGLQTTGGIMGPFMSTLDLNVSSINGNDARVAFTNNIQTSSMELYSASTTLMYWDSTTASSNINTSGYDVVAGVQGTFKIGASLQFNNQSGTDTVEFFFLKNGGVISQAGGIVNVLNNDEILAYCEIIEPLNNGDTINVGCYTANANVFISTINGTVLQSPAAILTMYKID